MDGTEVYSWRVDSELKSALEDAARAEGVSVSQLLARIAGQWLRERPGRGPDEEIQRRLHEAASAAFGTVRGGDPERASQARARIRRRLAARRGS